MNEDLEILRKILHREGYTPSFADIIINKVRESGRENLTAPAIYTLLLYDLGRKNSKDIAEYFEEYKEKGDYRTNLQKMIDKSPWSK